MPTNSCIKDSPSKKQEQKTFADLVRSGINITIINLKFNNSQTDRFQQYDRSHRWLWVANDHHFLLSYPHDVDVYSFGLLRARKGSLDIQISTENLTSTCEIHFGTYLAKYIAEVVQGSNTSTGDILKGFPGQICYSKIEFDCLKDYISNISGVKIGLPFWCYLSNENTFQMVEKSYVIYLVISIAFISYNFYPLLIEMVFSIEDRKMNAGYYYKSDSPYSPSMICKQLFFSGDNKYFAIGRIIFLVALCTFFVYYLKSEMYLFCNCSIELWNFFPHAENLYDVKSTFFGVIHFLLINICVFVNSKGNLDDFIILGLYNLSFNNFFFKTVSVSYFLPYRDKGHLSYKIKKFSLIFSYIFWSQIFWIDRYSVCRSVKTIDRACICRCTSYLRQMKSSCIWRICFAILRVLQFLANVVLVLVSTFFPVVSTVYVLLAKYTYKYSLKLFVTKSPGIWVKLLCRSVSHSFAVVYLYYTYKDSFNVFFNGISYVTQFSIFTLFLAMPRFPIQTYIYVIFITSFILYVLRFVSKFTKLYSRLLETILSIQNQNEIQIKTFDKIVAKHFPLYKEMFFLFVKILLCSLFFAIIFDTMQRVGYIKFGVQPDLATVISVIFLFGPPRLVEALLTTDFTSRVHMKEEEIKTDIEKIGSKEDNIVEESLKKQIIDKNCCCNCPDRCVLVFNYICTLGCCCFICMVDEQEDKCIYCVYHKETTRVVMRLPSPFVPLRQNTAPGKSNNLALGNAKENTSENTEETESENTSVKSPINDNINADGASDSHENTESTSYNENRSSLPIKLGTSTGKQREESDGENSETEMDTKL